MQNSKYEEEVDLLGGGEKKSKKNKIIKEIMKKHPKRVSFSINRHKIMSFDKNLDKKRDSDTKSQQDEVDETSPRRISKRLASNQQM